LDALGTEETHASCRTYHFRPILTTSAAARPKSRPSTSIVNETIKVLKHRGDFSESALHDYVADSRTLVDLPDVISAEWLHKTAGDVADAFLAWAATGGAS
jgi:hypothetical protein